jgi:hypothetical protein
VVGLVGTAVFLITLATVQQPTPAWLWLLYGVGMACWLGFVLLDRRFPPAATALLLVCLLLSVAAIGPAPDGTPVLLTSVALVVTCSLPRLSSPVLAGLLGATFVLGGGGALWWEQGTVSVVGDLIMALIGLSLRQRQVQAPAARFVRGVGRAGSDRP